MPRVPRPAVTLEDRPVDGHKRVLLAAPRGYCAGVDRAVVAVDKALERYGSPVYVRKQIVHNKHVVSELEQRGAIFVDEVDEVPEGSHLVFSAHGVSPMVKEAAAERELQTIDATCPLVTKVHREATRFAKQDRQILLIGHVGHEEVEGTAGHGGDNVTIVNSPDEADTVVVPDPDNVVWLSQTTLSVDETMETVNRLRARFPNLQNPPSDDICYATQNRQVAIKKVAAESDLVIVVGSANSSNSVRLVEVALQHGACPRCSCRRPSTHSRPPAMATSPRCRPRWRTSCSRCRRSSARTSSTTTAASAATVVAFPRSRSQSVVSSAGLADARIRQPRRPG
jgi:4-hydroxy-3-methylbut-2-enyl diphosphate reductase